MKGNSRRGLLGGFAVGAAVLIMAGAAYACTVYVGKVTLSPVGSTTKAVAVGKAGVHEYCSGGQTQTVDMNGLNQFTVTLAPGGACIGNGFDNTLAAGTYQVRWVNMTLSGVNSSSYSPWAYNCNVSASNVHHLGNVSVNSSGDGTSGVLSNPKGGPLGTATPSNGASGAVNVCITKATSTAADESAPELALWVV